MAAMLKAIYKNKKLDPVISFVVYRDEDEKFYPYLVKIEYESELLGPISMPAYEFLEYGRACAKCGWLMDLTAADLAVVFGIVAKEKEPEIPLAIPKFIQYDES